MTDPVVFQAAPTAPVASEQREPEHKPEQQPESQRHDSLPEWARESLSKANREAAQYRSQVNELKPLADQMRALEEASKSEAQRLADANEALKRDAETARAEAVRYKVAATHGIPADDFDLLGSGTEEEIAARAQRLAAYRAAAEQAQQPVTPTAPQRRPVEQLRPGATPADAESEQDVLYASLFGNQQ